MTRRIAITLSSAVAAPSGPALAEPAPDAAIERAIAEVVRGFASPAVSCSRPEPRAWACVQTNLASPRHYAVVGIRWEPARSRMATGQAKVEALSVGPGGGGFAVRGQTGDHRYDVVSFGGTLFGAGERALLPSQDQLI